MYLRLIADDNTQVSLFDNEYFNVTDIDGFTEGNSSISSSTLADSDGDTINAQSINARDITITVRFKQGISPELAKRYLLKYFKLKKEAVLELDYQDRISRLTGYVQSIDIPRFTNGVSAQIGIHCSSPFWEDVNALDSMISNVITLHHWPIHPTEEEPIIMGLLTDTYQATIVNNGDADVGMIITINAEQNFSKPRILIDRTGEWLEVDVEMYVSDDEDDQGNPIIKNKELIINTHKGQKSITLDGVNMINKLVTGSTWLQLDIGSNTLVASNSLGGAGMIVNVRTNERYL